MFIVNLKPRKMMGEVSEGVHCRRLAIIVAVLVREQ